MNCFLVLRILGALSLFLSATLLTPIPFSLFYQDGAAWAFLEASAICFGFGLLLSLAGMDLVSAGAAAIATLGNIGPGLGSVGPTDNYAHVSGFGKMILTGCMLLGRLELFTVMVLFFPSFWRR
jgi:Trk-type K+ transport system membrane component